MPGKRVWAIALLSATGICSTASAGIVGDTIHIRAENAAGKSAEWSISSVGMTWINEKLTWKLTGAIDLRAQDGEVLGRIEGLDIEYIADPVIALGFLVTAGGSATNFTITSALLNFPAFDANARASAAITVTDLDGNGATVTGNLAGSKAYRAMLNGGIAAGTQFASLVDPAAAGTYDSSISSHSNPAGPGYIAVGNTFDMQSQFAFSLSANDQASGTSVFVTIPAPGAAALAGLGLLGALRRRR